MATGIPYDRLIPAFEASLGKWDPVAGAPLWEKKAGWPEVETAIARIAEPFGLMVMVKIDQGRITSLSEKQKSARFIRRKSRDGQTRSSRSICAAVFTFRSASPFMMTAARMAALSRTTARLRSSAALSRAELRTRSENHWMKSSIA